MALRRINGVAAAVRAISANNVTRQYLHHASLNTRVSNLATTSSRLFSVDHSSHRFLAGTMFFSVAASVADDVHAKETVSFSPNQVVLYQYEACPFCNKVKGANFITCDDFILSFLTFYL